MKWQVIDTTTGPQEVLELPDTNQATVLRALGLSNDGEYTVEASLNVIIVVTDYYEREVFFRLEAIQ